MRVNGQDLVYNQTSIGCSTSRVESSQVQVVNPRAAYRRSSSPLVARRLLWLQARCLPLSARCLLSHMEIAFASDRWLRSETKKCVLKKRWQIPGRSAGYWRKHGRNVGTDVVFSLPYNITLTVGITNIPYGIMSIDQWLSCIWINNDQMTSEHVGCHIFGMRRAWSVWRFITLNAKALQALVPLPPTEDDYDGNSDAFNHVFRLEEYGFKRYNKWNIQRHHSR